MFVGSKTGTMEYILLYEKHFSVIEGICFSFNDRKMLHRMELLDHLAQ